MDAIREVGPGGHYLGCAHTQNNFKTAFWKSNLFDYKPFETWAEEGERDTYKLATDRVAYLLNNYQQPALDPAISQALSAYVAEKKASMPDSFYLTHLRRGTISACVARTMRASAIIAIRRST